jgi:ribA/ribD-fused uncharacterized protein
MKWVIPENITYNGRWVSNWFSNMLIMYKPIIYQGITYYTVENFYQAMKMPKDRIDLRKELAHMEPHVVKRAVRNKNKYPWREDWTKELSIKVMKSGLEKKFTVNNSWGIKLIGTEGDIVEWNNWGDVFWGADIKTGEGENHLGLLLMNIRKDLQQYLPRTTK